jgi:hypothetical protein
MINSRTYHNRRKHIACAHAAVDTRRHRHSWLIRVMGASSINGFRRGFRSPSRSGYWPASHLRLRWMLPAPTARLNPP